MANGQPSACGVDGTGEGIYGTGCRAVHPSSNIFSFFGSRYLVAYVHVSCHIN
jgi:hypothetical protein